MTGTQQSWRAFFAVFLLQILVGGAVGMIFSALESRYVAGLIAGSLFVALGVAIIFYGVGQSWFRKTCTFVLANIHLGVISIPMVASRVLNANLAFEEVRIWGLWGPQFHALSTRFYGIWMLVAVAEGVYWFFRGRGADPGGTQSC